jgi:hypothetical protein
MKRSIIFTTGIAALSLVGCAKPPAETKPPDAAAAAAAAIAAMQLPVSLNAVMVGVVDHASDPLFDVGNATRTNQPEKTPKTDADWRQVEYHAYQMIVSGRIMQIPGTGPMDKQWTSDPRWKPFADAVTDVGSQMLQKAQAKTTDGFEELGDKLVDACEGCHKVFKPEIPTMRIMHAPAGETAGK